MVTGDPSGEAHAAAAVRELRRLRPEARLIGTGGERLADAGVEVIPGTGDMAMLGFLEIVPHLARMRGLLQRLTRLALDADLVMTVDYSGFNLRLLRELDSLSPRGRRTSTLHYIPPKTWAWGGARARELARLADRVACILPFEEPLLRRDGVRASYVGNPLLDGAEPIVDRAADGRPLLALFPGSRTREVGSHSGIFLSVAAKLRRLLPELEVAVGMSSALPEAVYRSAWREWADEAGAEHIEPAFVADTSTLLGSARAAIAKSGTITLECALAGLPHVVGYRVSRISWRFIGKRLAVGSFSLPNLIAGREIVPELIQAACVPSAFARALRPLLDASPEREAQLVGFEEVRELLEAPATPAGASVAERVALMAADLLQAAP